MARHLMVDIETLDTKDTAVVFQVGAVTFDKNEIYSRFEYHVDIIPQIMMGRTIDPETVGWWKKQDPSAWNRSGHTIVSPQHAIKALTNIVTESSEHDSVQWVWSNSPSFDAVILRSLAISMGMGPQLWDFRRDIDLRTIKWHMRTAGIIVPDGDIGVGHHAVNDCLYQIKIAQAYLSAFDK